jgi:hypothetical protein
MKKRQQRKKEKQIWIRNARFEVLTVVGHKGQAAQEKFFLNCLSLEDARLYNP